MCTFLKAQFCHFIFKHKSSHSILGFFIGFFFQDNIHGAWYPKEMNQKHPFDMNDSPCRLGVVRMDLPWTKRTTSKPSALQSVPSRREVPQAFGATVPLAQLDHGTLFTEDRLLSSASKAGTLQISRYLVLCCLRCHDGPGIPKSSKKKN